MSLIQDYIDSLSDNLRELIQQNVAEIADIIFDAYKGASKYSLWVMVAALPPLHTSLMTSS